ncbi:mucin-15 [Cololabis saira]|uniref:mucin-15 n=1 Tax=Cololabis saira TaxID=129043 RepID=UPI002AD2B418|nr:mucin-15 [Cololabis saira]
MAGPTEEEENVAGQDGESLRFDDQNADPATMLTMFENVTPNQPELTDSPGSTNSTQNQITEGEEDSAMAADNTASFHDSPENTELQSTALVSERNGAENITTQLDTDKGLNIPTGSPSTTKSTGSTDSTNSTGSSDTSNSLGSPNTTDSTGSPNTTDSTGSPNTTDSTGSPNTTDSRGSPNTTDSTGSPNTTDSTGSPNTTDSTGSPNTTDSTGSPNATNSTGSPNATDSTGSPNATEPPEINKVPTTHSGKPFENSEASTVTIAIPERANKTGKGVNNSDRGVEPDTSRSKRGVAWLAVLGTAAAVACVGLVAYFLKKKRNGFSHRKLVEEFSPDPVLRLDNSDPLDLNFAGSGGYYNPGLQGHNIQMTSFPGDR